MQGTRTQRLGRAARFFQEDILFLSPLLKRSTESSHRAKDGETKKGFSTL